MTPQWGWIDFADDQFRFGLSTVLDGIACRA